jgi:hypothetical protein
MTRAAPILLLAGAGALALLAFLGGARDSYLAAWLLCLGAPVGALGVLMTLELTGAGGAPVASPLRATLAALPLFALLSVPVLLAQPAAVAARAVAVLVVWIALALLFMRAPRRPALSGSGRRVPRAAVGLALYLVAGSVAATDWAQSLDPQFASSSYPLTLIISQCSFAVAAAVLLSAAIGGRGDEGAGAAVLLAGLLGAWGFLHFTQFLIVWSANLPHEVVWYQRRDAGLGRAAEWIAAGAAGLALLLMLPRRLETLRLSLAAAALLTVVAHAIEAFWLITPASRGSLAVTGADALALAGAAFVLAGAAVFGLRITGARHAT